MTTKIIAFLITLIVNVAVGAAVFFGMLLSMNGYNESDAEYGIVAYIVLAVIMTIVMSAAAAVVVHILLKRNFSGAVSALIGISVFSVLGVGLMLVCGIIGIIIAEVVRVNF